MSAQKANPRRATQRFLRAARTRALGAANERFWREWHEQAEREWVAANAGKIADAAYVHGALEQAIGGGQ